jgi:hypothetical protein
MIEELRTNFRDVRQPCRSSDPHADSYPTSESPFDSGGHVIARVLSSLQRSLDPDDFHLARRNLPSRFAVTSRSHQAALMAGQHSPKGRHRTFLRLRMRTAEADQSLRAMLIAGGVIWGLKLMATSSHQQYDGVYRYSVKNPIENHVFDRVSNPLGVPDVQLKGEYTSKPYVLEYKHNVDASIQEFENQEKNESDVNLVVAWDIGLEWKRRYAVTSLLDVNNIQHRPFHGVTHIFRDQNSGDVRFYGILLSELVEALNDFDASLANQVLRYGETL